MVRTNTAILPGADAAVVRIKETRRALAMTLTATDVTALQILEKARS